MKRWFAANAQKKEARRVIVLVSFKSFISEIFQLSLVKETIKTQPLLYFQVPVRWSPRENVWLYSSKVHINKLLPEHETAIVRKFFNEK